MIKFRNFFVFSIIYAVNVNIERYYIVTLCTIYVVRYIQLVENKIYRRSSSALFIYFFNFINTNF